MAIKVMDCDLVVLGAAGCGLVAAVKAADVSGKKVIVLEKAKKPGGATIFAHGMGSVGPIKDTKLHREAGYPVNDSPDITGQFFDWLLSKGGVEKYFRIGEPNPDRLGAMIYMPVRTEKYKDHPDPSIGPGWMGSVVVDKMLECCEKTGIPVLTETRARKFITDDKGKVTGVLADAKDGQLLVNCKVCIIGAGGFGANYEKLQKYWPDDYNNKKMHNLCPPTITGDCIDMAEEIGAAIDQTYHTIGPLMRVPLHHPYGYAVHLLMQNPAIVSVNLNGERWMNEGSGMHSDVSVGSQPKGVAYSVADNEMIEKLGERLVDLAVDEADFDILSLENLRKELAYEVAIDEEGASGNHSKMANTLVDLALKMNIDPKAFVATINRYNEFCDNGKDLDFGKDPKSLVPIRKPPFYAIFGHRWTQCTKGSNGICVNGKFEVLNTKGEAIPGLYAGGDACTIYGGYILSKPFGMGAANPDTNAPGAGSSGAAVGDSPPGNASGTSAAGINILSGEGNPPGGLGGAFISGYHAGINAGNYLKNI